VVAVAASTAAVAAAVARLGKIVAMAP